MQVVLDRTVAPRARQAVHRDRTPGIHTESRRTARSHARGASCSDLNCVYHDLGIVRLRCSVRRRIANNACGVREEPDAGFIAFRSPARDVGFLSSGIEVSCLACRCELGKLRWEVLAEPPSHCHHFKLSVAWPVRKVCEVLSHTQRSHRGDTSPSGCSEICSVESNCLAIVVQTVRVVLIGIRTPRAPRARHRSTERN
jgi:hypothetical protein